MKVYYDTSAVIRELFGEDTEESEWSFKNDKIEPYVSLSVKQEVFHKMASSEVFNNYDNDIQSFIEARDIVSKFFLQFRTVQPNLNAVGRSFDSIVNNLINLHGDDFPKKYQNKDEIPDGRDIIHFSFADMDDMDIIVTTDTDWVVFEEITTNMNIERIIILNEKDFSLREKIEV